GREDVRREFCRLDDTDVLYSLKRCMEHDDRVLADLSRRFMDRDFFRVTFLERAPSPAELSEWQDRTGTWLVKPGLARPEHPPDDASMYLLQDDTGHRAYENVQDAIEVLERSGEVRGLSETDDTAAVTALSRSVV